jgi:hypothetical protein
MLRINHPLLLVLTAILALDSCTSGKKAFLSGNYFEAVMTSTNRLRRDARHSKSIETLKEAYPLAVSYYDDRAKAALASNAEFKWTAVVESYTTINVMYDEIRRSPAALKVIPNPVNYYAKLDEAKQNAAEEKYAAGLLALAIGNRDKAKQAYWYFKDANAYVQGYKDVDEMMEAALWAATVRVVMEPIPVQARSISVSAEFFDNKVSEFLHSAPVNEFVRFYTRTEAQNLNLSPDHIIQIAFDEFAVGQVFMHEREVMLEKDSVIVATYVASPASTGNEKSSVENLTDKRVTIGDKNSTDNGPVSGNEFEKEQSDSPTDQASGVEEKNEDAKAGQEGNATGGTGNQVNTPDPNKSEDEFPTNTIDEKERVTICHIPPGNEANRHTLVISRSALDAHLAHGDVLGSCEDAKKGNQKPGNQAPANQKGTQGKPTTTPKGGGTNGGNPQAMLMVNSHHLLASAEGSNRPAFFDLTPFDDTVKIYSTVKATLYHYRKTTTSKGVLSFRIIDARTQAVLTAEKMPGEFVWVSEWATFNGDERALSPQQLQLSKQREAVPPQPQDLFIEFTRPIYEQVTSKIATFYKGY